MYRLIPYEKAEGMGTDEISCRSDSAGRKYWSFYWTEGGFEEAEIEQAMEQEIIPVSLGKRILRTETAGLTILSILMYHLECEIHNL